MPEMFAAGRYSPTNQSFLLQSLTTLLLIYVSKRRCIILV